MSTGPDVTERELELLRHLTPGRDAGRMVDGVDMIIDGVPAGRRPPRWERKLALLGYDPAHEGPITFEVLVRDDPDGMEFDDVRAALGAARSAVESGRDPWDVRVEAVTRSGRSVTVVNGTPVVGMAIGALQDPPITVIEGPSVLPKYAPGERPRRHRRRKRSGSRSHGAPRSANARSISSERVERLAQRARHLTPGRHAGRTVDGVDLIIDGEPAGRMPPRWIEQLEKLGYLTATDGPVEFDVVIDGQPRCRLGDIREALYEALASIAAGCHPDRVRVEARAAGGSVEVVRGHQVIGMAIGALEDEPVLVIQGPSVLPAYAPGEKRQQRHRRSANAMSTVPDVDERERERQRFVMPGRVAGRMVDGVDMIIDGIPAGRRPPRWERKLAMVGYDAALEGPITFEVHVRDDRDGMEFDDVRTALRAARSAVESGRDPRDVTVEAVTPSGRSITVVNGTPIIGMAIGALQDPPITVIEGPSVLPEYAPGEKRPKRHRRRHRR